MIWESQKPTIAGSILFAALIVLSCSAAAQNSTVTLDQALATAFENHPHIRTARADLMLREAFIRSASVYPFNPELTLAANARAGDQTSYDIEAELEQEFEIAGQRKKRRAAASADRNVVRAGTNRLLQEVASHVRIAFVGAAAQRELLEIANAELEISRQLVHLAERRLAAGAGTKLEIAVARAELSKSEEQVAAIEGEYAIARAELAYVMGLGDGVLPQVQGDVGEDEAELAASMSELMAAARLHRQDLVSLLLSETAAQKRLELARAEAFPNLRLGVFGGQEAGDELLVGGSVSIPIPLFQRNQGGVGIAEAEVVEAQARTASGEQDVMREVATAYQQYVAARKSLVSLEANVVTTEEALRLLRRAFETGKSTWVEILVMRRTLFDAQRALVKVRVSAHLARVLLDVATGTTPVPKELLLEVER